MRVLVTGATGFLGGALCGYLRARGYEITATGRSEKRLSRLKRDGFETVAADLSACVPNDITNIDAVVHTAALSAPWGPLSDFQAANVAATRNIVTLAKQVGVERFVNISSPSVYFALKDQLHIDEAYPLPKPINNYAKTKAVAEQIVLSTPEIGPISLRPRGIYGAGDSSLLPRLLRAAQSHPLPLFRGGRAKIDLTHVTDVCAAIEAALRAGDDAVGQSFNISGGEVLPIRQIIDMACARAGIAHKWRRVPFAPAYAAAKLVSGTSALLPGRREPRITPYALALLAFEQSLNISKAQRILGWTPRVRFETGLEDALSDWGQG